jgi:hypothetical protein
MVQKAFQKCIWPLHQLAEAADVGGGLPGCRAPDASLGAELRHLEMDRILARPVVEQLATGDVAGITLGRHGGIGRVRPVLHLQRADVIAGVPAGRSGANRISKLPSGFTSMREQSSLPVCSFMPGRSSERSPVSPERPPVLASKIR